MSDSDIRAIIHRRNLSEHSNLLDYIRESHYGFTELAKIAELSNSQRENNAAYYTRQDICYSIIKNLPDAKEYVEMRILEPSIGVGNFLPTLIEKYSEVRNVTIDVVDIDPNSIEVVKELVSKLDIPENNEHVSYFESQ